jgi:hypothetical protein
LQLEKASGRWNAGWSDKVQEQLAGVEATASGTILSTETCRIQVNRNSTCQQKVNNLINKNKSIVNTIKSQQTYVKQKCKVNKIN